MHKRKRTITMQNYLTLNFVILSQFPHEPLKGHLADEQVSTLLVLPNFSQRNCSRPIAMWPLHALWHGLVQFSSGCKGKMHNVYSTRQLTQSCKLVSWCFPTSTFSGSLLCSRHGETCECMFWTSDKKSKRTSTLQTQLEILEQSLSRLLR